MIYDVSINKFKWYGLFMSWFLQYVTTECQVSFRYVILEQCHWSSLSPNSIFNFLIRLDLAITQDSENKLCWFIQGSIDISGLSCFCYFVFFLLPRKASYLIVILMCEHALLLSIPVKPIICSCTVPYWWQYRCVLLRHSNSSNCFPTL